MNSGQRAAIAAIIIAAYSKCPINTVYSYEASRYISMSGSVTGRSVNAYDYGRSCYVSGNASSLNKYSLYDYGESAHIDLTIDGNKFSGYDYASSYHFSGTVSGKSVSIYDYQTSTYYNFSS